MPIDAWAMDAAAGAPAYSGQDLRMGTVVPFMAGAGASLGVRSGVRPSGSGTDLLVQAQASPNMTVKVNPGVIVAQGAISATQGAYTWTNDTTLTRTIAAAHATLARTDLVVVRIRDANVDTSGGRDGDVIVITGTAGGGTPSLPTDATYYTLAQITVPAAAASIVAGNITDRRLNTAALGGVVTCTSTTRPTNVPPGQLIYETDTDRVLRWTGSQWRTNGPYRDVQNVSVATPQIAFNNIPTYLRELRITGTSRTDGGAANADLGFRVNNDGTVQYRYVHLFELNTGAGQSFGTLNGNYGKAGTTAGGLAEAGLYGSNELSISGWNSPHSQFLTFRGYGGYIDGGSNVISTWVGNFKQVGAYSSIQIFPAAGGNFAAGTEYTLTGWE